LASRASTSTCPLIFAPAQRVAHAAQPVGQRLLFPPQAPNLVRLRARREAQ
jgi:hypothetical protein